MSGGPGQEALYIAWTVFQRRQVSMAELVKLDCVFLPTTAGGGKFGKAISYLKLMWHTVNLLRRRRPAVVWLQIPQVPLLWASLLYQRLFDRNVRLVADCHNAMFVARWSKVPLGLSRLGRCDLVLVHNESLLGTAKQLGVPESKMFVLEDVPPLRPAVSSEVPALFAGRPHPWVLFPGSFSVDEPIEELLEAARLVNGGTIVITGRHSKASANGHDISRAPANVVMAGFLEVDAFNALLCHCDVVLALTKFDGIQLSVCNEALGFEKPMVMSDTSLLRTLFGEAAVLVRSEDPAAIAAGIETAYRRMDEYASASTRVAERRRADWLSKYDACQRMLSA